MPATPPHQFETQLQLDQSKATQLATATTTTVALAAITCMLVAAHGGDTNKQGPTPTSMDDNLARSWRGNLTMSAVKCNPDWRVWR